MPDDAREPFRAGSVDRLAIELSIVEWQTVTQVLSLAPYVRVWKVLQEIERQARAQDALRAAAMAECSRSELHAAQALSEQRRRDADLMRLRAQKAEDELRHLKRKLKRAGAAGAADGVVIIEAGSGAEDEPDEGC